MSVLVETDGPVMTIVIDRPERRNAVDAATAAALRDAFEAYEKDDRAQVAVLTGAGGHFCAGFDLKAFAERGCRLRYARRRPDGPDPAPALSSPRSRAMRWRAAWSSPCGATCGSPPRPRPSASSAGAGAFP